MMSQLPNPSEYDDDQEQLPQVTNRASVSSKASWNRKRLTRHPTNRIEGAIRRFVEKSTHLACAWHEWLCGPEAVRCLDAGIRVQAQAV